MASGIARRILAKVAIGPRQAILLVPSLAEVTFALLVHAKESRRYQARCVLT